jgi:hypothetical protein
MYAISYSTPEEHGLVKEAFNLDSFEFLSDLNMEFGEYFGFFDVEKNSVYRGYVGVNPETENIVSEVDYLVGDNIKVVLKAMEEL